MLFTLLSVASTFFVIILISKVKDPSIERGISSRFLGSMFLMLYFFRVLLRDAVAKFKSFALMIV